MKTGGAPRSRASPTCLQGSCSPENSVVPMFDQLLAGGATSLLNLIIHAIVMGIVLEMLLGMSRRDSPTPQVLQYTVVIVAVGCLLYAAPFLERAYAYAAVGAAPSGTDLV